MQENTELNTALVKIRPQADEEVIALHEQALRLCDYAEALVILSDDNVKAATNDLIIIGKLKKAMEAKKREYLDPPKVYAEAIRETYSSLMDPIFRADKITGNKILVYRAEQKREHQEQEEINRLRLEAAQKDAALHNGEISEPVNLVEVVAPPPKHYRAEAGTLGTAEIWQFEVIDFSLLPDDYKLPDMVKIRKVVTAGATIPGVKAWQEETLKRSARKDE